MRNRRRVVYYTILLLLILGELLGERNYIIIIFPEYDTVPCLPLPSKEKKLLSIIATLQQQVNIMLLQQQGSRVEVTRPLMFSGKMEKVSMFINAARLYLRMKMNREAATTQIVWVL